MTKPINVNKIIITGGAGYIGNKLVQTLPKNIQIVIIDNFHIDTDFKRDVNHRLQKNKNVSLIKANVSDIKKYEHAIKNVDVVLYMASLNSYKESNADPVVYLNENSTNLQIFIEALKKQSPGVKKLILTSTRGIYGEGPYLCSNCEIRMTPSLAEKLKCTECQSSLLKPQKIKESDEVKPSSYYGLTKKFQEDLLKMYSLQNNIPLDIFRIFNVFGEDQGLYYSHIGIVPMMHQQIVKNKEIYLVGGGDLARDFIYINEVIKVLTDSIFSINKRSYLSEIYNLGSGNPISISDLANYFESLGYKFKKNYLSRYGDIKYSVANPAKVSKTFNITGFMKLFSFLNNFYKKIQ